MVDAGEADDDGEEEEKEEEEFQGLSWSPSLPLWESGQSLAAPTTQDSNILVSRGTSSLGEEELGKRGDVPDP